MGHILGLSVKQNAVNPVFRNYNLLYILFQIKEKEAHLYLKKSILGSVHGHDVYVLFIKHIKLLETCNFY